MATKAHAKTISHLGLRANPKTPTFNPNSLLTYRYAPFPKSANAINHVMTQDIAKDPSHPFYARTIERMKQFDPQKLHWRVMWPVSQSSKKYVRQWATRRFRNAFILALSERGLDKDGKPLEENNSLGGSIQRLSGALKIQLANGSIPLTADKSDVRDSAKWLLGAVLREQQNVSMRRVVLDRPGSERGCTPRQIHSQAREGRVT